jgi:hypothetical protein
LAQIIKMESPPQDRRLAQQGLRITIKIVNPAQDRIPDALGEVDFTFG